MLYYYILSKSRILEERQLWYHGTWSDHGTSYTWHAKVTTLGSYNIQVQNLPKLHKHRNLPKLQAPTLLPTKPKKLLLGLLDRSDVIWLVKHWNDGHYASLDQSFRAIFLICNHSACTWPAHTQIRSIAIELSSNGTSPLQKPFSLRRVQ